MLLGRWSQIAAALIGAALKLSTYSKPSTFSAAAFPAGSMRGTIGGHRGCRIGQQSQFKNGGRAMDGIAISTERIASTGTGVSDVGTSLAKEIVTMSGLLDEIRSGWQSDSAAPAFAATMQHHLDNATQLKNALVSHGATLVTTAQRLAEAETHVAAGVQGAR